MTSPTSEPPPGEESPSSRATGPPRNGPKPVPPVPNEPVADTPSPATLAALAGKIQVVRERRQAFLGNDLISETGWEMLIALYRSDVAMQRMTVTNLCQASHAPASTALRWIDRLEELGLVTRLGHRLDRRIVYVELSPTARTTVGAYLTEVHVTLYGTG